MNYYLYGLVIAANRSIPGLASAPTTSRIDVQVWLELMPPWLDSMSGTAEIWHISDYRDEDDIPVLTIYKLASGSYFWFCYADGTEFVIDQRGIQIWATWPTSLSLEDTATYLLGPVIGFVLLLRGTVCLHSSAIVIENHAIALVGPSGAGKSTTAAAFAHLGYPVLADDIVALVECERAFLIQPAYPRLRLWPASVQALYGCADALPCLTPNWDKRYLDLGALGNRFQTQPLPVAAIYLLDTRRDNSELHIIEPVSGHQGLMNLIANTYATHFKDKQMRAQEFSLLSRVSNEVPLRRVIPNANPTHLSKLCHSIVKDFHMQTNAPKPVFNHSGTTS